jgi:RNA recognition motif-containing protein
MENKRKLFIHNLSYKVMKEDLETEFEKFGKIESCNVPIKEGKH